MSISCVPVCLSVYARKSGPSYFSPGYHMNAILNDLRWSVRNHLRGNFCDRCQSHSSQFQKLYPNITYMRRSGSRAPRILNLCSWFRHAISFMPQPLPPREKGLPVPYEKRWVSPEHVWTCCKSMLPKERSVARDAV
jgi:hypothetical protein